MSFRVRKSLFGKTIADDLDVAEPPSSHDAASDLEWLSTGARPDWLKAVTEDLISQYALVPLTEDDVAVVKLRVCGTRPDRDNERFSYEVLEDFQLTLPGKALLIGHQWGPPGVGRVIAAELEEEPDGEWALYAMCYMIRGVPELDALIRQIEGGTIFACSIGFFAPQRVVDSNGVGVYTRGPNGEPAEAIEVSLVFLGAQYGAEVIKSFGSSEKCERCGRLEASCRLDAAVVEVELTALGRLVQRKREAPADVEESFGELHRKIKYAQEAARTAC